MKRFTYSSGSKQAASKGKQVLSLHGGTSRMSSSADSPRKRKRSPVEEEYGALVGMTVGSSSKLLKKTDSFEEEDEDDDLDKLGRAALEEYELTQKLPSSSPTPIPKPAAITLIPNEPHTSLSATTHHKWHNPYISKSATTSATLAQDKPPGSTIPADGDPSEKIRQLQEQNYSKDGEVKVLRSEIERLSEELRQKESHMHSIQTQLLSEKQAVERQLRKETQSLSTKLSFVEQENFKLRENLHLEQMHKSSLQISPPKKQKEGASKVITPLKTTTKGRQSSHQSKDPLTTFVSTETFIPLSQMSSNDVTPIQIGRKRPSLDDDQCSKQAKGSTSSAGVLGASTKGVSTPRQASTLSSVKWSKEQLLAMPSEGEGGSQVSKKPSVTNIAQTEDAMVLDVPSTELTGTQLLMLLVHHNLLKIPNFKSLVSSSADNNSPPDSDEHSTADDTASKSEPVSHKKLTNLLSLLQIERKDLYTPTGAPSNTFSSVPELYSNSPSVEVPNGKPTPPNLISTPVRRPKLQLQKPYTSGRLEVARSRTRTAATNAAVSQIKSLSASNTPAAHVSVLESSDMLPGSLFSSVDKGQLSKGIASLLLSADSSILSVGASYSQNRRVLLTPTSFSGDASGYSVFILLKQAHDIITRYHTEQLTKIQQSLNASGFISEFVEEAVASPKPIFSGSRDSYYSKTSSELLSPAKADQELVSQALEILETLVTYNKGVRERILEQPPKFSIDNRPSSPMDASLAGESSANTSHSTDEPPAISVRAKFQKETDRATTAVKLQKKLLLLAQQQDQPVTPVQQGHSSGEILQSEDGNLVNLRNSDGVSISGKIWVPMQFSVKLTSDSGFYQQQTTPSLYPTSRGFGQLLSILLELPAPRWKESLENVLSCIRILSALARDCSPDVLERFSGLLSEDSIGICLDKEDPELTLAVLSLLSHMIRSPRLAAMFCTYKEPSCIPYTCYQCLLKPPATENADTVFTIRIQIIRLLSNILVTKDGPAILLEACSCAHEILKSLVSLLVKLVDTVYKPSQWTRQEKVLLCEVLSLMHQISVHDRYFDTHREECEDGYIFALHKLSWLLKTGGQFQHQECLVQELLYFCEDLDDSQEHSSEEGAADAMDTV